MTTSSGWATVIDATAPAHDARASSVHVAGWSSLTPIYDLAMEFPPNSAKDPGAFYVYEENQTLRIERENNERDKKMPCATQMKFMIVG